MLRRVLFQTRLGDWLVCVFERLTGLGILEVAELEGRSHVARARVIGGEVGDVVH